MRRSAFTIVELLVVITIMGILMSLVFPAVGMMREQARRTQCVSNQHQIAVAAGSYAASKGYMPPAISWPAGFRDSGWSGKWYGWVQPLLTQLGSGGVYNLVIAAGNDPRGVKQRIDGLVCPADTVKVGNTYTAPLSYAVNGGRPNNYSPGPTLPYDWSANGVWDMRVTLAGDNRPVPKTTLDYIGSHDGLSTTILAAENLDTKEWAGTNTFYEYEQCILWQPTQPNPGALNMDVGGTLSNNLARPSSKHPGGFVVVFCDGNTRFVNQAVNYQVYAQMMTSWGFAAKAPGSSGSSPDPAWQANQPSLADLNP